MTGYARAPATASHWPADAQARFTALAEQSLADQATLEAQPQEDFAAYVAAFQASL